MDIMDDCIVFTFRAK